MAEKTLGVDFGSSGIKIAQVQTVRGGAPTVIKQSFLPLDPGLINAGAVDPENISRVAMSLKQHLAEQKYGSKDAIMGLSSADDVVANRATVPYHSPREFRTGINFDVMGDKSLLIGVPEDAELDGIVLGEFEDATGAKKLDVFLAASSTQLVETQAEILKKAGLNVAGADLSGLAALRASRTVHRSQDNLDVLVDIGRDVLTVLVHSSGTPHALTMQRGYAGQDADRLIGNALLDEDPAAITREKLAKSLDPRVRQALDEYSFSISAAIEGAVKTYFKTRKVPPAIAGITLIGGGALLQTLPESIHLAFRCPVVIGLFDEEIGGNPDRYRAGGLTSSDFLVAVGLAMGAKA